MSTPDAEVWGEVQPPVDAQQPQGRLLAHTLSLTTRHPQKDTKTHTLVMDSILRLRYFGVPSDYIPVSCWSTEVLRAQAQARLLKLAWSPCCRI